MPNDDDSKRVEPFGPLRMIEPDSARLSALRKHIENCPLGFIQYLDAPGRLLLGRDRTENEIVVWLKDLHEIAGLPVIDLKANKE